VHRKIPTIDIAIALSCIDRITLRPGFRRRLPTTFKSTIKGIDGCSAMKVYRSTLIRSENWKALGESAI